MPKFDRLERVEMRKGNKIETMETTVVLFGPSSVPADLDGLAAACKDFGTKSENLLAGAKYKPVSSKEAILPHFAGQLDSNLDGRGPW